MLDVSLQVSVEDDILVDESYSQHSSELMVSMSTSIAGF